MSSRHPSVLRAYVGSFVAFVGIAACTAPAGEPPPPTRNVATTAAPAVAAAAGPTVAVRYTTTVLWDLKFCDLIELYLPEHGVACHMADAVYAFPCSRMRNVSGTGEARPTERVELPADVVADILALADATMRQRELRTRVEAGVAKYLGRIDPQDAPNGR